MHTAEKTAPEERVSYLDHEQFRSVREALSKPAVAHPELVDLFKDEDQWETSGLPPLAAA